MSNYVKMSKEDKYIDKECMICLEEVNTKLEYIKCYNCNKLFHMKCMNNWKQKSKLTYSSCVHCTKDDLIVHKFEPNCCVGCWNWIFPKVRRDKFTEVMVAYD